MHLIEKMADSGVDALSLDSLKSGVDLTEVAKRVNKNTMIMGNINPVGTILSGKPNEVKDDVIELLKSMDSFENFILSAGCDLPQNVPLENINSFMKTGKKYRIQ